MTVNTTRKMISAMQISLDGFVADTDGKNGLDRFVGGCNPVN
jgi:hypothetical protein